MEKTMYTLQSAPMIHTPGIVRWAQCGYKTSKGEEQETFITIMADGYNLERKLAIDLLSGKIKYKVEGDKVVFEV
jgi:hypothetical protein